MDSIDGASAAARFGSFMRAMACIEPISPATGEPLLAVGQRLLGDRFEVVRVLGSGGMGVVYEAWDAELEQAVALKLAQWTTPEHAVRLRQEFRALHASDHPGLVQPHELFSEDTRTFFTMELVSGTDFVAAARRGVAPLEHLVAELLDIVAALHEAGRVHRDLKPGNVLVTAAGRVRVIDLGLSRVLASPPWFDVPQAGTERFMAPELARGEVTPACDMFAVGVISRHALRHTPNADARLTALTERLVAADPAARPNAREALAVLGGQPLEGKRHDRFVGRRAELARLGAAVDAHRLVYVYGPCGIGKTALLDAFARESNKRIFRGVCRERETHAFKAFDGIAYAIAEAAADSEIVLAALTPRQRAAIANVFPELAMLLDERGAEGDVERDMLVGALLTLLAAFESTHTVVVIDDVQWCDDDGRDLLFELIRRAPPSLSFVVASRTAPVDWPACEPLCLGPLSQADAELLVCSIAGVDPAHVESALSTGGRSPLCLLEWMRRTERHGGTLEHALARAADELHPRARALLDLLTIAGGPLPRPIVRDALGTPDAEVERSARRLRREDWAVDVGKNELCLIHDAVRAVLSERLAEADRVALHGRLARAFERHAPSSHDQLATHWLAADETARARRHVLLAASRAYRRSAFAHAAERYRLALTLDRNAADRGEVELGVARALAADGRPREAAEAFLRAGRNLSGRAGKLARRGAVVQQIVGGDIDRGMAALGGVFAEAGLPSPATGTRRAVVSMLKERALLAVERVTIRATRRERTLSDEQLAAVDLLWNVGTALSFFDAARALTMQTRCLRALLGTRDHERLARSWAHEAMVAALRHGPAHGHKTLARARSEAAPRDARVRVIVDSAEQVVSFAEGRFAASIATHDRVLRFIREHVPGTPSYETASGFLIRALAAWYLGDVMALREAVTMADREVERRGDRALRSLMAAFATPLLSLLDGDAGGATRVAAPNVSGGVGLVDTLRLVSRVMAALHTGDAATAQALFEAREARGAIAYGTRLAFARQHLSFWRATAALASVHPRVGLVKEAIVVLDRSSTPWAGSLARLLEAQLVHRTTSGRRATLSLLSEAEAGFVARDMRLFARAARDSRGYLAGARFEPPHAAVLGMLAPGFVRG